jgi:hypothetical protein
MPDNKSITHQENPQIRQLQLEPLPSDQIQENGGYIEIREKCEQKEGGIKVISEIPAMNKKDMKTGCAPSKGKPGLESGIWFLRLFSRSFHLQKHFSF